MRMPAALGLIVALGFSTIAWANESTTVTDDHSTETEGHSQERKYKNVAGPFIGFTGEGRRDNGLALGFEYTRRINQSFGLTAIAERTWGDLDFWVFVFPVTFYKGPWVVWLGPGWENADETDEDEFLMRAGIGYAFEIAPSWEIVPSVNADFVNGENAIVVGVSLGKGF